MSTKELIGIILFTRGREGITKAIREYQKHSKDEILQWMMFLENPEAKEVVKIMEENEDIKEAKEELDKISQDDILRRKALKTEYK